MARESYSYNDLVSIAMQAGFNKSEARTMAAIALAESGGRADAHNPKAPDDSYGLWQINMIGKMGQNRLKQFGLSSKSQLYNPLANARAAYAIYKGQGLKAWTTYTKGTYKQYTSGTAPAQVTAQATSASGVPAAGKSVSWVITGGKPYKITQEWGNKSSRYVSGHHTGVDIGVPTGTQLYSVVNGKVAKAGTSKAWGNYVLIKGSDGNTYRYGHLSSLGVATGATVGVGSFLGKSGGKPGTAGAGNSTGPHLHFEVKSAGGAEVDPMRYVATSGTPGAASAAGQESTGVPGVTYDDFSQAFLDAYPEVADVAEQAIANGWTQARFDAAIKNTRWWQERSSAQQEYDTKIKDNPGQAAREVQSMATQITQWAAAKGIKIGAGEAQQLATEFTRNGVEYGSPEFEMRLGGFYTTTGTATGEAAINEDYLKKKAADYGVTLSGAQLQSWTQDILSGKGSAQGFEDSIREQAKTLYKPIAGDLDRGLTTRDVLMPFLGIASQELGADVTNANLTDPKWTKAVFGPDGKTMMTADQWTSTVRTDGRYGWDKTANARNNATQLTGQLAQAFGALG